jgi:hypothetical protein
MYSLVLAALLAVQQPPSTLPNTVDIPTSFPGSQVKIELVRTFVPVMHEFRLSKWPRHDGASVWIRQQARGKHALLFARGAVQWPAPENNALLEPRVVYRYDPIAGELTEVDDSAWAKSDAPISSCPRWNEQSDKFAITAIRHPLTSQADPLQGRRAHFQGTPVPTAGSVDLTLIPLDDNLVAVLSARQYRAAGILFAQPEKTAGCYFQQIYSQANGQPAGEAIHLSLPIDCGRVYGWVFNRKYVIYFSEWLDQVCIIHLDSLPERMPRHPGKPATAAATPPG